MLHVSNVYSRSSAAQLHPTLCDSMDCNTPSLSVHHQLPQLAQTHESMMPSNHLILCRPLLLLPSIFSSIGVFFNESALHIKWPKYWSFNFSISLSSEYSGLISFGIGWFDLFVVQGTLKSLLWHCNLKNINSLVLSLFYDPTLTRVKNLVSGVEEAEDKNQ